jgi:hypothetical protein
MSNSTEFDTLGLLDTPYASGGLGRTGSSQGGYQIAAVALTVGVALVGGIITGYIMKLPIIEQVDDEEEMFDDEPYWITPEDYVLKLAEVRVQEEEMQEKPMMSSA